MVKNKIKFAYLEKFFFIINENLSIKLRTFTPYYIDYFCKL